MKKFLSIILCACICVAMVGCNKNETNVSGNNEGSSASLNNDDNDSSAASPDSGDNDSSSASSDSGVKYKPSDEILNADFSSGLIQIGNDIFKDGGYMTVAEFCEQMKGKYTYEEMFYDREYSTKNRAVLYLTNVDDAEMSIRLEYANPVMGAERTVPNCVVMKVCPNNDYTSENTWLPSGIECRSTESCKDDIIELYKSKGYVDVTSEDYANDFLNNSFASHIGSYVVDCKGVDTMASVQLDGNNLYGSVPIITVRLYCNPEKGTNSFNYGSYIYYTIDDMPVYWQSDLG